MSRTLPDILALNIEAIASYGVGQTVTLRVTGDRVCRPACQGTQTLRLYSLRADPIGSQGVPPSEAIQFAPNATEVDTTVTLPVGGDVSGYPFDRYTLRLGGRARRRATSSERRFLQRS